MEENTWKRGKLTDIHMHIIPHADDGAENMNMARAMVAMADQEKIGCIIATPHSEAFDIHPNEIRCYYDMLKAVTESRKPKIGLALGCEVYCEPAIMEIVTEKLKSGHYPTMNGTAYVLTEFYVHTSAHDARLCIKTLIEAGFRPIIAHMERYDEIRGKMKEVDSLLALGALIQVNTYNLMDWIKEDKDDEAGWAKTLVRSGKVHFLGSDSHKTYYRPPNTAMGVQWVWDHTEADYARSVIWENAKKLLGVYTEEVETDAQ